MQGIYTYTIYPILSLAFWILSFFNPKIKKGFELRKNKAWIKEFKRSGKVIWFHVASGEFEYAKPVIRALKRRNPDLVILVTYFSPSVLGALSKYPDVDVYVPMPWDTPWHWKEFLNHYNPSVLAIARTDTWPNMVWETRKKNIPSILFSATLSRHSGRYASFWGRLFYGSIISHLSEVSCVTQEDADNFGRLDEATKISTDGDTRFDQVIYRLKENRPLPEDLERLRPTFVAGSTWEQDEAYLLPALEVPFKRGLNVVIAPHEPTPVHLEKLEEQFKKLVIPTLRYSKLLEENFSQGQSEAPILLGNSPETRKVVIIDKVGILADLYRIGQIAFVGGSFKKSIHSVMEPAAAGAFTFFGPYHFNNREALALKSAGFAVDVTAIKGSDKAKESIQELLLNELTLSKLDEEDRRARILDFVKKNAGTSEKIATWILNPT